MKKLLFVCLLLCAACLASCDFVNPNVTFDNSNITPVEGQEGYYTDDDLLFCSEIRGSYSSSRPFTLDATNEHLRIWDNLYLYEGDYFQLIVNESPTIFYQVKDEDLEYVTVEEQRAQATIQEGKDGIYKVTFDLSTKLFDLEYKEEITTPVYEEMKGCDVFSLKSDFTQLTPNPDNPQELMVSNYTIQGGEVITFHNHGDVHLSNYKVILDPAVQGTYASALETGDRFVSFSIGGTYNLYVNPVTYTLRVELTNPDTAQYSLQVYKNGEPTALQAVDPNTPYLFTYQLTVKRNASIPIFISADYFMYTLTAIDSDYLDGEYEMFNQEGTYVLEINLKTFTVTATPVLE